MEKLDLTTPDGHVLQHVRLVPDGVPSGPRLVMCHGITTNKDEDGLYTDFAQTMAEAGVESLRFDFRGHGDSAIPSSNATVAGMLLDLWTALRAMNDGQRPLVLLASSFGASIVLNLAQATGLAGVARVVFWNPITNYASAITKTSLPWGKSFFPQEGLDAALQREIIVGAKGFRMNPVMAVELYYYHPESVRLASTLPLLVLHGQLDTIVDVADSIAFVARQNSNSAKLLVLKKSSHGLEEERGAVFEATRHFILEANG